MAPDFTLYGHQLGEAHTSLRSLWLKASLPICLGLTLFTTDLEARTEPLKDAWSHLPASWSSYESTAPKAPMVLASVSPSSALLNSSPTGQQWSHRIQLPIPDHHPAVDRYIRFYQGAGRKTFGESLQRAWPFAPIMAGILESHHVPPEMIAIVLVESAFKGHASHRGAGGYWQMLSSTARKMGLRVDRWVDERRDPIKSTQAAAKYLRSLYDQYNSWALALAAYNAGGAPVCSGIRKCQASDFWDLSQRGALPSGTRAYVPKVMAVARIMRNLEDYGFEAPQHFSLYDYESIQVPAPLKLEQVAQWINVSVSDLRDLNPALREDRLPPDGGVDLNLPSGARDKFDLAYETFLRK